MKINTLISTIILSLFILSCQSDSNKVSIEEYKREILKTERAFAQLVKDEGLKIAFTKYAAEDAILKRGNSLLNGKKAIEEYYANYKYPDALIEWEPDFIDVSEAGDLAYTYGYYKFEATNESGEMIKDTGVFHTVWKRQPDGEWRYVWD